MIQNDHTGESNKMITTDTIITPELLAGLDKCPFCGAGIVHTGRPKQFSCWTFFEEGNSVKKYRTMRCIRNEHDTLRARVKDLEEAGSLALYYAAEGDQELADKVWNKAKGTK